MILRPYQTRCVNQMLAALRSGDKALAVMSTGGGKTECFIDLIAKAQCKTAVLVGRNKLVEQTVKRLGKVLPDVGVWSADYGVKRVAPTTVVSIHSADQLTIPDLRLIVCDEAHNFNDGRYMRFYERHHGAKIAGFTATPWRGGYEIFGEDKFWPRKDFSLGLKSLIEQGYLVRPISKSMDVAFDTKGLRVRGDDFMMADLVKLTKNELKIKQQVADAMPRLDGRKFIVWQCVSIEQAEMVRNHIPEEASIVHSKMNNTDYQIECFESGKVRHLVNVMMMHEGYDFPPVDAIVMMRPTRSPTLYVQTIGRGLRPYEGKTDCLVLDYGKVIENCGPLHDPIVKSEKRGSSREPMKNELRVCVKCLSYVERDLEECPDCGYVFPVEKRDVLKNLEYTAADKDIMKEEPKRFTPRSIEAYQYTAKSGNKCIRLLFMLEERFSPVQMYFSEHPYSWNKGQKIINGLTPWGFETWEDCYNVCEQLVFDLPEWIEVENKNGFETITRISSGKRDPNLVSKTASGFLLEKH